VIRPKLLGKAVARSTQPLGGSLYRVYYADLTVYSFSDRQNGTEVLNIGWLDGIHLFAKAKPSEELLNALFRACLNLVNQTRGFHVCELCDTRSFGIQASRDDKTIVLGSAEIRVAGGNGVVYAAPNLIYHYVAEHDYNPPVEFTNALLQ
jgi:hypothetical protein